MDMLEVDTPTLTPGELAKLSGVSVVAVHNACAAGLIPSQRHKRRGLPGYRFTVEAANKWLLTRKFGGVFRPQITQSGEVIAVRKDKPE